ncbi:MAG: flagellar hook-associated protein FlgK [Pirellulaceae bacterium]
MPSFDIGLTALRTSQYGLQVTSNNISNANTEGYHRRSVHLGELAPGFNSGFQLGTGVGVRYIERLRDQITESSLTNVIGDVNEVSTLVSLERQLEAAFLNDNQSLSGQVDSFFGEITKLTSSPDETAQRVAVVDSANRLATSIRQSYRQITGLKNTIRFAVHQEVDALNADMARLSDLSKRITQLRNQGVDPNSELDARDAVLNEIAERIGVTRNDINPDQLNLMIGNASMQQNGQINTFSVAELDDGTLGLLADDLDRPIAFSGGKLAALTEMYNSTIPKYQGELDTIATEMMRKIDSVHATGVGPAGSFGYLAGTRPVESPNFTLENADTAFPIEAGDLVISVTDPNGVRRTETITIDPAVDTLNDIATRISAISNISATVNPTSFNLQIFAQQGYEFDFAGNLETNPDLTGFTGTTVPTFSGAYTGDSNTELTFEIDGTGEVGVTDDLFVNVYGPGNVLLNRVSIGNGYEAGTDLEVVDGVQVSFSRGTVTDTEQFSTLAIAESDESGILTALGINSFFTGENAGTIGVREDIRADHSNFSSGSSSDLADTENLFRFLELEDYNGLAGNATFSESFNELNTDLGLKIAADQTLSDSLQNLQLRLTQERDAYSAVDINEEFVYLQEFQKSYEAAVRIIQTADDMLNQLFSIVG